MTPGQKGDFILDLIGQASDRPLPERKLFSATRAKDIPDNEVRAWLDTFVRTDTIRWVAFNGWATN